MKLRLEDDEYYCSKCDTPVCAMAGTMIVLKDDLWKSILAKLDSKDTQVLCRSCIEKYLGRPLKLSDLKFIDEQNGIMLPCNFKICKELNLESGGNAKLRFYESYEEFKKSPEYWRQDKELGDILDEGYNIVNPHPQIGDFDFRIHWNLITEFDKYMKPVFDRALKMYNKLYL